MRNLHTQDTHKTAQEKKVVRTTLTRWEVGQSVKFVDTLSAMSADAVEKMLKNSK